MWESSTRKTPPSASSGNSVSVVTICCCHLVAAVVDDDVEGAVLLGHPAQEVGVGLVADLDDVPRVRGGLRVLVDVDPDERHLRRRSTSCHMSSDPPR